MLEPCSLFIPEIPTVIKSNGSVMVAAAAAEGFSSTEPELPVVVRPPIQCPHCPQLRAHTPLLLVLAPPRLACPAHRVSPPPVPGPAIPVDCPLLEGLEPPEYLYLYLRPLVLLPEDLHSPDDPGLPLQPMVPKVCPDMALVDHSIVNDFLLSSSATLYPVDNIR